MGVFGDNKYPSHAGAALAFKDAEVQRLISLVTGFKSHLERIMLCIDELSGTYRDLVTEVQGFYANDPAGLANSVTDGYQRVTQSMASDVPRKVTEILRTKVVKSCDDWLVKLEAVRRLQEDPALQDAANKLTKYLEKSQNASDSKAQARNTEKLQLATSEYTRISGKIGREMDVVLVSQKAEYSKLVVRVMQFQQAYFKQAYNSCEMMPLMDTLRDLVESNAWEAGEQSRLAASEKQLLAGQREDSDHDEFDSSDDDLMGGSVATSNTRQVAASNQAVVTFNKLADDLEEMFYGGRTPRERDLSLMKDAMFQLNSTLLQVPKKLRGECTGRVDTLDMKWKQAVDVHMRLGIQDNPVLYTGGINKPATAAPAAQAMDISHVPPEHLEMLRGDPALAPEFDQMYGDGFAATVLGITPRPVAAVDIKPTDEHLEMLQSDPSLAPKFDKFYGPGSAERFLQGGGNTPQAPETAIIPPEHADMLRNDPSLAPEFDRIYGTGASASLLATVAPEVSFNVPPDHVAKLRQDPSLGPRFDAKYGAGASQYYLGSTQSQMPEPMLTLTSGTMMEGEASKQAAAAAKQAAVDKYQQARADHSPQSSSSGNTPGGMMELMPELSPMGGMNGMMGGTDSPYGTDSSMISPAAMPDHSLGCYDGVPPYVPPQESTPCSGGYRLPADLEPPGEAHIEMLRGDPSLAVQFEEVFGPGAAQYFLNGGSVQQASSVVSPSMSMLAPEPAQEYYVGRQSLDYSHDQDSDDDIIATTSSAVAKPSKGPSAAPAVVDSYSLPPMGAPMGDGPSPEDSESPRTVRWRQVNQQRVAMGLSPKPHPGAKM